MHNSSKSNPQLINFFSPNMGTIINQHLENVKRALSEYDVVIFMARKAVCLFKAFVENGLIENQGDTVVLSSRALTFETSEKLYGKRIAVIDDVVVFGKSIERVMDYLQTHNLDADVYIIACEKESFNNISFKKNISAGWQYLTKEEIHQLSEQITEYIAASGISYNIDQPIYRMQFDSANDIDRLLIKRHNVMEVADGLQEKFGIRNFSIHYNPSVAEHCLGVDSVDGYPVVKIRFIYKEGERYVNALPFVFFSFKSEEELDGLYDDFLGDYLKEHIGNGQCRSANKLKVLQYCLAEIFMKHFLEQNGLGNYQIDRLNEKMLFSFNVKTNEITSRQFYDCDLSYVYEINKLADRFELDPLIASAYSYLMLEDVRTDHNYAEVGKDADVNQSMVTYHSMLDYIKTYYDNADIFYVSLIADIFIDKGILIPVIMKKKNTGELIRGFKLGEIFHLTRENINLFHIMLYHYQVLQNNRLLDRTEFEKLSVLFLRKVGYHGNNYLSQVKNYGEDCYSICYTRFGPRISDSKNVLEVSKYSTLANRMENIGIIVPHAEGKYIVSQNYKPIKRNQLFKAQDFALDYSKLRNAFSKGGVRNNWVRSYDEFITLLAIGNMQKDKLFSLAAELHLLKKTDLGESLDTALYRMFHIEPASYDTERPHMYGIMDGIQSGLWKYICYEQEDLIEKVFSDIRKVDSDARHLFGDFLSDEGDANEYIGALIKRSGDLLMRIVAVYVAASKYKGRKSFSFRNYIYEYPPLQNYISEAHIFSDEEELYNELLRLQMETQSIIDKCNIISETGSAVIKEYEGKYQATYIKDDPDVFDCIVGKGSNSWYLSKIRDDEDIIDNGIIINFDKSICTLVENGTKRASTNIENALHEVLTSGLLEQGTFPLIEGKLSNKVAQKFNILYNAGGINMSINNNISFSGNVGKVISGDGTVDNSTNVFIVQSDVLAAIRDMDVSQFSEEIRNELSAIQNDCKNGVEKGKEDGILKRLGSAFGKVSFETVKAVVPKIVLTALTSGGYLPS